MFHGTVDWYGFLWPSLGWLAVDLFFALSGFVIAASYEQRLAEGLTVYDFLKIRLLRLYPLYFVGLSIAVLIIFASLLLRGEVTQANLANWDDLPFSLFMLPSPPSLNVFHFLYPLNIPAWSLLLELMINVLYAVTYKLWTKAALLCWLLVSGGVIISLGGPAMYSGFDWNTLPVAVLRCAYSFPAGVLLFKLYSDGLRLPPVPDFLCILAFPLLLLLPQNWGILFCILVGFPLLIALSATSKPNGALEPAFVALGAVSYAIYTIHYPLLSFVGKSLTKLSFSVPTYIVGAIFLPVLIVACFIIDKLIDTPVRRYLSKRLFKGS
jgi:peptidoglycan/LPS O-acetylase OafA/YrhL